MWNYNQKNAYNIDQIRTLSSVCTFVTIPARTIQRIVGAMLACLHIPAGVCARE